MKDQDQDRQGDALGTQSCQGEALKTVSFQGDTLETQSLKGDTLETGSHHVHLPKERQSMIATVKVSVLIITSMKKNTVAIGSTVNKTITTTDQSRPPNHLCVQLAQTHHPNPAALAIKISGVFSPGSVSLSVKQQQQQKLRSEKPCLHLLLRPYQMITKMILIRARQQRPCQRKPVAVLVVETSKNATSTMMSTTIQVKTMIATSRGGHQDMWPRRKGILAEDQKKEKRAVMAPSTAIVTGRDNITHACAEHEV